MNGSKQGHEIRKATFKVPANLIGTTPLPEQKKFVVPEQLESEERDKVTDEQRLRYQLMDDDLIKKYSLALFLAKSE